MLGSLLRVCLGVEDWSEGVITGPSSEVVAEASGGYIRNAGAIHIQEATPSTVQKALEEVGHQTWLSHLGTAEATTAFSILRCSETAAARLAGSGSRWVSWQQSSPTFSSSVDIASATAGCLLAEPGSAAPRPPLPLAAAPDQGSPALLGLYLRTWTSHAPV